jgi:hypothetical protein
METSKTSYLIGKSNQLKICRVDVNALKKGDKPTLLILVIYKEMLLFGRTCASGSAPRIAQSGPHDGVRAQNVFHLPWIIHKAGRKEASFSDYS